MKTQRALSKDAGFLVVFLLHTAMGSSLGLAQVLAPGGADIGGQSVASGLAMPPGGSGTLNYVGQKGNYTVNYSAGTNPNYDGLSFFKRPDPYTSGIPAGWQSINGYIWDCKSSIEQPPTYGSFFAMRVSDINGNVVADIGLPIPVQWCSWGDAANGGHYDIWDQARHPVNNPNPPKWAPDPPDQKATDGEKKKDGDPVDLATGLFILEKTDLAVPDIMPLALTRTYRQNDTASRTLGIGTTHPYDLWLARDNDCSVMQLIQPDGARETYTRTSGTDCFTASLVNQNSPSPALQSTLNWDNARQRWSLKRKDGTTYRFSSLSAYARLLLMEVEDRNGNLTTLLRDSLGRLTRIISPSTKFLQLTYDTSNRITQAVDNIGRTVTYTYDASGRLWKVTDPANGITEYSYDAAHLMLTIKDPKGIVFLTNTYDTNGRVSTQTQADSTTYQFAYVLDGNGKVIQTDVTDPRGFVRRLTFNSAGYALTDTLAFGQPEAQTTTFERQAGTNLILSVTDALTRKTAYTYDTKGNILTITRLATTPNAVTTTFTYDSTWNQVTSITDPLNHTTNFGYDSKGNLTSITNALNQVSTITVNAQGQPLTIKDPLNNTTTLSYAAADLVSTTDPLNRASTRFVDSVGRLLAVTNALGQRIQYDVDTLNRITKLTDALNGQTQFTYDANGNLLTVSDAKSQVTTYTYNTMDRLATRKDALLNTETYTYDNNGNVATVTDRKGHVTTYTYDALNRRTKATYHDGTSTNYTYDAGNRITQVQEKDASQTVTATITRTYDGLDRLTQEVTAQGTINYTYDNASRRATMTVVGQPQVTYTYDNANRLTQVVQGTSTVTIAYDDADRRTSLSLPNGNSIVYAYDAASQLTSLTYKSGTTVIGDLTYTYDGAGNRIKVGGAFARTTIPPALTTVSYNANNQQLTFGANTETYDLNGNLATVTDPSGTATYTWNARDQLTGISATGFSASFTYDSFGRRTGRTVNGVVTNYVYDGLNPVQEKSGATVTANLITGLGIDEFFQRTDGVGTSTLLSDALGSTIALGDATGTLQTQYTYEPFGYATTLGQANTNSYKYTGREDDGSGLSYYRARYYHPRLQRFISEDPIGFYAGPNFYAYVSNKVMIYNDPLGLDPSKGKKLDGGISATWGTNGMQCTAGGGCRATTTFPPEVKIQIQGSYNEPPNNLNPINANVNIYTFQIPGLGIGVEASIGTYFYDNPNQGTGGQTTLQQGLSIGLGVGAGFSGSIQK
ncbi:RHS repeat-associated core domain-containing protein [Nitrospira moscoviensis]|uniref:Rhs family protein n=1 Tax=Nitrospira moscoviensis TaxID=42253 RepID=A0A0K2GCB5_NITMO|nr:RHS repeat-associated core domain-containing protein [Nitrospira moscoviensis]ALA58606.1 Rhs family protein [Nitrospira moscoviensis]